MAESRVGSFVWVEAVGLPLAAAAAGLALERALPGASGPLLPFLALVAVAVRRPGPPAWAAYAITLALGVLHAASPLIHPRILPAALANLILLAAAGAIVVAARGRARGAPAAARDDERGEARRFRRLLASSPDGIWRVDSKGITLDVNPPMARMLGTTPEKMIGAPFAPFFTEEGLHLAMIAFEKAQRGEPVSFEVPLRRQDGSEAWTLCSTHPIVDANGVFVEGFGILRDITDRHRAETERQQALSLLEATLESTADGLLVVDREGRITRFNERFAMMWRIPSDILASGDDERALGFVLSQLQDPERFLSKVKKLYATPDADSFDTLHFLDGRVFERYSMPHRLEGEIVGRVWSFRDVTERERANEEQRLAMEREASIARNLDAALLSFVMTPEGEIIRHDYFSKGAEALYGVSREVLETDPRFWLQRIHPEDAQTVVLPAQERLCRLQAAVIEVRYQSSKGIYRWHRAHLYPRLEADGLIHVDGIESDVTERVKLEEQLRHAQKMEAIGQLAGGVAHDFNNVLTAVIGYSDLLLARMASGDPNRRSVEEIRKGGERAAGLTRQLLAFGRRMTTQPRLMDPDQAIRDLEPMLRRLVGEDIRFDLQLAAGGKVRMDPTHLEQVVINLMVNARDALPQGGVVRVRTDLATCGAGGAETLPPGRYVRLVFSDNGTGIAPEVLEHIFEPFFTTKDPGRGTGLGLATVYGIVRQNRGDIRVRSEPGSGTEFEILLPEVEGEERSLPAASGALVGGRERIFLVEDEPQLLSLGREILAELGYEVSTARTGEEAMSILNAAKGSFDLLVTDVVMPELGGRELAKRATALHPRLRILFVSGYTGDWRLEEASNAPAPYFLEKPYTPLRLALRVREVLDAPSPHPLPTAAPR